MNRDTVAGSITDSQSLNRFSYVEGNPLTYVDLNGQARTWLSNNGESIFLYSELALAGIGMIPIASDVTNVILMGMDLAVGDYTSVALDSVGLVPLANDASNSTKLALISAKISRKANQAEKINMAEKAIKSEKTVKYEVALRPKYEIAVKDSTKAKPKTDFYVKENGDVVPATGYRYMSSADHTRMAGSLDGFATYVGYDKMTSKSEIRSSFQIADDWSDLAYRGEFDTLQAIDDIRVPTTFGNTTNELEPITRAYPEYGKGGARQLIINKPIRFSNITETTR